MLANREQHPDPPAGELTDELTDELAALLDGTSSARTLKQALGLATRRQDETAVRVAVHLLGEARRTGRVPSNRSAGRALGLSHAGVAKALQRLRDYIALSHPR